MRVIEIPHMGMEVRGEPPSIANYAENCTYHHVQESRLLSEKKRSKKPIFAIVSATIGGNHGIGTAQLDLLGA